MKYLIAFIFCISGIVVSIVGDETRATCFIAFVISWWAGAWLIDLKDKI